jgi:sialidase-1
MNVRSLIPPGKKYALLLGAFAALSIVAASAQAADASGAPVFENNTNGYACYRIPAMVRTSSGRLLAFAEARRNTCNDFGDVRIVMRSSTDNGRNWSPLSTVAENGSLQAGNPAPVIDATDKSFPRGRIFLLYCTGDAPEDAVMHGKGTRRVWYRTSADDGATWSQPTEITASVKPATWRHYATGPGHALQLTRGPLAGRLFIPANHSEGDPQPKGQDYAAHGFYSDDHGATWQLGQTVPYPGGNESTAAQNHESDVVMNIRDQSKQSHARIIAISGDGGATWKKTFVARDLPDPVCEGSMIEYGQNGRMLLFINAGDPTERRDLTASVSLNGGLTWTMHTVIARGPAAYSDIVLLDNDHDGVLWERGNSGGIYFTLQ